MSNSTNTQAAIDTTFTIKNINRKEVRIITSKLLSIITSTIRVDMDEYVLEIDGTDREIADAFKYLLKQLGEAIYQQDVTGFLSTNKVVEDTLTLLANEGVLNKTSLKTARMKIAEILSTVLNPITPEEKENTMTAKSKETNTRSKVEAEKVVNEKPTNTTNTSSKAAPTKAKEILPTVEKAVKEADAKIDEAVETIQEAKSTKRTYTKKAAAPATVETKVDTEEVETSEVAKEVSKDLKAAEANAKEKVEASTTSDEISKTEAKLLTADQELKALKKAEKKIKKAKQMVSKEREEAAEKELKALKKAAKKLGVEIIVDKKSEKCKSSKKEGKRKKEKPLSTYEKCRQAGLHLGEDIFTAGKILTMDTARVLMGKKASFDKSKDTSESQKIIEKVNAKHATNVKYI